MNERSAEGAGAAASLEAARALSAERLSRRRFLSVGAAAAALGLGASAAEAGPGPKRQRVVYGPLSTRRPQATPGFDPDLVLLLNRATFGFNLADYEHAASIGYDAYLQELLGATHEYTPGVGFAADPRLDPHLSDYAIQTMSALEVRDTYGTLNMTYLALRQACTIQLLWAVYGSAQLTFRMFEFWNTHFNVDVNSNMHMLWPWLRDVVLAHSMGTVPGIIRASASPAMLRYLNNDGNRANSPNENYARELMELHTLGADNGYTQADVEALARILTGWTYCNSTAGCGALQYGDFRYQSSQHNRDDKVFLGAVIEGRTGVAGMEEGEEALQMLAEHPATAEFIATKLCRYFLGGDGYDYEPPEDIVQMVTWQYLNSDPVGDIRSMLQIILQREVLTTHATPKYRRPMEFVAASLRATGTNVLPTSPGFLFGLDGIAFALETMGQLPNHWGPPNGPHDSQAWSAGGTYPRWDFLQRLVDGTLSSTDAVNVSELLARVGATAPGTQAAGFDKLLTGGRMSALELEELQAYIGPGEASEEVLREALWLALCSPTFQFK